MGWQAILILLYVFICEQYQEEFRVYCQRFTNNKPVFTDEEVSTIFIFGVMQKNFEMKAIYNYAANHPGGWFPNLPSCQAFIQRTNRLAGLFPALVKRIVGNFSNPDIVPDVHLTDSFPVVLAGARRSSKACVARAIVHQKSFGITV